MKTNTFIKNFILIASVLYFTSCDEIITPSSQQELNGVWKCTEQHEEDGQNFYDVEIEVDETDSTTFYIYNFLNLEGNPSTQIYATAHISGNYISIPHQTIGGHTIEGSGNINANYTTINLNFTDDLYGGTPWNVSATYSKY